MDVVRCEMKLATWPADHWPDGRIKKATRSLGSKKLAILDGDLAT